MDLPALTAAVRAGRELSPDEVTLAANGLAEATVPASAKEDLLESLSRRGETAQEIAAFARRFRDLARNPGLERWAGDAIDVCGTGGDRSKTFNVSTVVAFVLAADGVPVLKHGNRSITSHCGSADLLEGLGIRVDADVDTLRRSMSELNFAFLFAPHYHPAFKEIGPIRKTLANRGVRTVFNLLGPLLNPARPAHQVMGVFAESFVPAVAGALDALGLTAGLAVHSTGVDGRAYDELTIVGRNRAVGFGRLRDVDVEFNADAIGMTPADPAELTGGDCAANLALLDQLLTGRAPRGLTDTIALNAAAGLHVVGRTKSIPEGVHHARELLVNGTVRDWLVRAREFYRT